METFTLVCNFCGNTFKKKGTMTEIAEWYPRCCDDCEKEWTENEDEFSKKHNLEVDEY